MVQVMARADGAAVRVQIEGLIGSLVTVTAKAGEEGDSTVLELLSHLHAAHAVARRIETRTKGVKLARPAELTADK